MTEERWLPIPGYVGLYAVSDRGQVMSMNYARTGLPQVMRQAQRRGYRAVQLQTGSEGKTLSVHSLVMLAFAGPRPKGMQVNHVNGIKHDNRLANLEYVTASENRKHSYRIGLASNAGENHSGHKLTDEIVRDIIVRLHNGESQASIARDVGVDPSNISHIKRGRLWTHVCAGELL